ncbi:MAG: hypothetical protein AB9880_02580 [Christensenellales bacterium]
MNPEEQPDTELIKPQGSDKRPGLIRRSREMLDTAVSGLRGHDMSTVVDEFTSEMTLVAEGLHQDLVRSQQELAQLSADQTILNEQALEREERILQLQRRLEALEKKQERQTAKRGTLTTILRQVTLIAAIIAAAWVITSLLKTFGGGL